MEQPKVKINGKEYKVSSINWFEEGGISFILVWNDARLVTIHNKRWEHDKVNVDLEDEDKEENNYAYLEQLLNGEELTC